MTENKRFILTEQFNGLQGVIFVKDDCADADVDTYYTVDGTVDLLNELNDENKELKARVKSLRNDLIDYSALVKMLGDAKALEIEDMIWNTMGYKTQTEFDDDFADYREKAKKRWRE